jgi:hypothetical protein
MYAWFDSHFMCNICSLVIIHAIALRNFDLCHAVRFLCVSMILALSANYLSTQHYAAGFLMQRRTVLSVIWHRILRRIHRVVENVHCLCRDICLSLCWAAFPSTYISATVTGQIYTKFGTGKYMKICLENPNLAKIRQNIGQFT